MKKLLMKLMNIILVKLKVGQLNFYKKLNNIIKKLKRN